MNIKKYKDQTTIFVVKFLLLFGIFYAFSYVYIGITTPGGYYFPWLDRHLNYVRWFRSFLLYASSVLISCTGHDTVRGLYTLHIVNGGGVRLIYSCIGFGILSFWWAFVISFPQTLKAKMKYFFAGTLFIILLNIVRISAVAYTSSFLKKNNINHHLVFNICAYGVLFFMMYKWVKHPYRPGEKISVSRQ